MISKSGSWRISWVARLLLSILMIGFIISSTTLVSRADTIDDKYRELQELQREIEKYRDQLQSKKRDENSIMNELTRLEQQLNLSEKELEYIQARISYLNEELESTAQQIKEIEKKLEAQKEAFNSRLVSIYKAGQVSYLEVLLTSQNLSDFMARLHYLKEIASRDTVLMQEYVATRAELEAKKQQLQNMVAELDELRKSEEAKREEVVSRKGDRERYLAQIQSERQKLEQALDELERQSQALEQIIRDLQAKGQKPQARPLSMIWPVSGGWISSYYGNRYHPILGYYRWHSGIDYAVDSGTPIKAAEDGTVIFAGDNGGYGLTVILDHGGGVSTLYAHCSKLLVRVGQNVEKGQTIALVGSTGLSTGPHLHFEVRVNGSTRDPLEWLP